MTEKKQKTPQLKVEEISLFKVESAHLENFVEQVYNQEFNFTDAEEVSDDVSKEFHEIDGVIEEYDKSDLEEFIKDGSYKYATRVILNDLCRKGLIKPGNYLVNVS
ncbi:hypothetical protein HZA97_09975 [Candidatus Woesearchaeota archaeon]|nr:hypothetical protein [Candidatus Woesearchaeota archaeon]